MTNFNAWMQLASPIEKTALANMANTSRRYLYQLAKGVRFPRPALAMRLAKASVVLRKGSDQRLPLIWFNPMGNKLPKESKKQNGNPRQSRRNKLGRKPR